MRRITGSRHKKIIKSIGDREQKIIYLAWMWANGHVFNDGNTSLFDDNKADVQLNDYELTFEVEDSGGINLDVTYDFYEIGRIIEIMGWGGDSRILK